MMQVRYVSRQTGRTELEFRSGPDTERLTLAGFIVLPNDEAEQLLEAVELVGTVERTEVATT